MKLLRWGPSGAEKPGMLDSEGRIRDLSDIVADIDAAVLSPAGLAKLAAIRPESLPLLHGEHRVGPCVARPTNFVCIGLNYADHAAETGLPLPKEPVVFLKALSAFNGPYDPVKIPRGSEKTDWEVELAVVIGTPARYVEEEDALAHIAGYCVVNDVSERSYQMERGGTWDKGKGCETFAPTGPWLVTRDEIADPQALDLWSEVDGVRMQNGNTRTMIFGVRKLVSYVSQFFALQAGDIISTGTPPGVGQGHKPEPIYLRAGQTMKVGVAGLGEQCNRLVDA